ncbi:MAG: vitamin B12 dependent methionine synthase [Eggerthellaceae bacterium]|jgi:hypothetical protein
MESRTETGQSNYRVKREEALHYLGYGGQEITPGLTDRIEELCARCERTSNPGFTYRIFPADDTRGDIRLTGTTLVLTGSDIYAHLKGAEQVAVLAATAGLGNERELRRLSATNGLDAAIYGAAGSAFVESVADACNARIVEEAKAHDLWCNWRFSPGYGDLPLSLQPAIIRVLDADKRLGITVTDTNLLLPAKSVTAFVGLFDTPQDDRRSCAHCNFAPYCNLRKAGTQCYR